MPLCLSCSFVAPTSFVFGDEDLTSVDCYTERFNYTFKVNISLVQKCLQVCSDRAQSEFWVQHNHMHLNEWP